MSERGGQKMTNNQTGKNSGQTDFIFEKEKFFSAV